MRRPAAVLALAVFATSCQRSAPQAAPSPAVAGPVAEGRALLEEGQLDAALARLQQAPDDAEGLYYQGLVWVKKAAAAPAPTAPAVDAPLPRGVEPPAAPEFKPEELQALGLLERATTLKPELASAHLAIATLLGPHAAAHAVREAQAAARRPGSRRGVVAAPAAAVAEGIDFGVDRVLRAYQAASNADPSSTVAAEGMIALGLEAQRPDVADAGFQALVARVRENAAPLVRYGDFLATVKKDGDAAIEQYRQALIWKPDDDATRGKVADIYLGRAEQHLDRREWSLADAQLRQAERFINDRGSQQAARLRAAQERLRQIR